MYTIRARFELFSRVNLADLIAMVGVYVIWDAHSKARPTYIGEGNVLKRFTDHANRKGQPFAHPWDGYVALFDGSTHNVHKGESKAVERLLLDVAENTDRKPRANLRPGSLSAIITYCQDQTLRVAVSGYDPLLNPLRPVRGSKEIKARWDGERVTVVHNWRQRRLRAPVVSGR